MVKFNKKTIEACTAMGIDLTNLIRLYASEEDSPDEYSADEEAEQRPNHDHGGRGPFPPQRAANFADILREEEQAATCSDAAGSKVPSSAAAALRRALDKDIVAAKKREAKHCPSCSEPEGS